ncbi:MAG: glycoside hydrolase family 97 protein [Melioribacteraceae bacterium]|nr:glycoside hydrolase family 97 protein [Melioribacteraceae bacterium]MDD3557852.1 glycoside hydrolase family 97 protein [Melioribacteraceae bacterium]
MKKIFLIIFLASINFTCCSSYSDISVSSPDGRVNIRFLLVENNKPAYMVFYDNKIIVDTSTLGFDLKNTGPFDRDFRIVNVSECSFSEVWRMPWGEQSEVLNNYNEIIVELQDETKLERKMNLVFRAFDDGIGFRYELPEQSNLKEVIIMDELTQFQLTGDHKSWWIPGDWDIYEHLYRTTRVSEIKVDPVMFENSLAQTYIPYNAVNTPVTMKTDDGIYLSFHEANLTNYSGMTLLIDNDKKLMQSELVGSPDESKVKVTTPFKTPWRTIQISETAGGLIESKLIVNLNEPNKLEDISWIKPMKYVGIWWEMHVDKSSWDMKSGKHGATTENAKRYIDFAAENNIDAVLIEGWNTGWEHWIGFEDREGVFDFVTPYSDYDLWEVVRYANEREIEIIMHHETSAAVQTYETQLDTAYSLCKRLGINAVKTGYVGKIIPKGEYHHGQYMVNHYRKVLESAAKYQIMINSHEPIKPTGIRRTFPNMVSREGLRGQEFNAWSQDGGNPPEHLTIVPFTRMLAGPIDFTPGIFDIKLEKYKPNNQVNTTLAHQLALYVVIYSPLQMAADLPENYEGHPAFQFIRDVGIDWEDSKVINGEIGDYVTIVRKEKETGNWFLGSITDENSREFTIDLSFLEPEVVYYSVIYKDAPDSHWDNNPTAYEIENRELTSSDTLNLILAEGGGAAVSFVKK